MSRTVDPLGNPLLVKFELLLQGCKEPVKSLSLQKRSPKSDVRSGLLKELLLPIPERQVSPYK